MRSTAPATAPSPREPFPAVLPERLELAEPGVCAGVGDGDQGLVGQSAQRIEDLAGRHMLVGTDGLGRGQAAAATEHRQPGEQAAFVLEQLVVAPVHHRPVRLLAGQGGAGTLGEQPEAVAEPFGQGGQRQRTQTGLLLLPARTVLCGGARTCCRSLSWGSRLGFPRPASVTLGSSSISSGLLEWVTSSAGWTTFVTTNRIPRTAKSTGCGSTQWRQSRRWRAESVTKAASF